ncbi:hypothetical protein lerEdw1_020794 [Lerista edwardsae]|nr:hypothetical protein lerEdw1_020794 [Lerista edwardsae]
MVSFGVADLGRCLDVSYGLAGTLAALGGGPAGFGGLPEGQKEWQSQKTLKPINAESSPDSKCNSIDHLRGSQLKLETSAIVEADASKSLNIQEQEKPCRRKDLKENAMKNESPSQENDEQPFQQQYLYVQSAAGLNGLNFLFPASQTPGPVGLPSSHLPSLNVPCMMVPSAAFAPFPLLYSPAVASQLSSAPAGSFPNITCMNLMMPGLTSTAPVFIGTPAVVAPNSSQLSTLEPPQQIPVLGSACSSMKTESPVCVGHPLTLLKLQQPSSTPLTPKNIHPTHQEAFFKTPGSLEDPAGWRKNEGTQSRAASSVQRRLEISSSSPD